MKKVVQSVKGVPDILPEEVGLWHQFEKQWLQLMMSYGYEEIRLPILESTSLFKRSIGEVTDIVEKEMFTFIDRNGDSLTLRPEGTAGCIRAGIEHGLLYNQIQKLWYRGPMFRHEKPQMGRYRQFNQVGIEAFGLEGPDIDVEHLLMMKRFWKTLKLNDVVQLEINSLGSLEARQQYRTVLMDYLSKHQEELDEDSQRRLHSNPLRILDSKNEAMATLIANAPTCLEYLDTDSKNHFEELQARLTDAGVAYRVNPYLVRGLDYYNRTVYEWTTTKLGAQGTVCAGGRYDGLVEQLGGKSTPGTGFAIGIERVLLLQRALGILHTCTADLYVIHMGLDALKKSLSFAEELRDHHPRLRILMHFGGGNFKTQFKKADKSGAKIALILGESEMASGTIGVKFLREDREQLSLPRNELDKFLIEYFGNERVIYE